jgi:hypothetical protein
MAASASSHAAGEPLPPRPSPVRPQLEALAGAGAATQEPSISHAYPSAQSSFVLQSERHAPKASMQA